MKTYQRYTFSYKKYEKPAEPERICDHEGCREAGIHRAPKDRNLKDFYWFCPKHIVEYNKNWDYYAGLSQAEVEREIELDLVGRRPTWKVNHLYNHKLHDVFNVTGMQDAWNKKADTPQNYHPNFSTDEHLKALHLLGLTPPVREEHIKINYKRLAKQYHPDKNGGNKQAEEMFKNITSAYHLLIKSIKN